ncbi:MAG: 3-phosphoglycerate dehydrogenase [Clostridia bacterium]|nr:3-phosphoglycerate dehydrogenase [Clostridia bacterium]
MEILKLNPISNLVENVLGKNYQVVDKADSPVGVLVRSFDMHGYDLPDSVLAVARAGAGVNNIPCDEYLQKGVVVFNTPGANANAVNELVITALLLGSRKIIPAIEWVNTLKGTENIGKQVEKGKKEFVGRELAGKKLGIIGLGAIGARVANSAVALGMEVLGYDPYLSVISALHLSRHVEITDDVLDIYKTCDYITIHVPYTKENDKMVNDEKIALMKDGVVLINCARGELFDNQAVLKGIKQGKISRYVCDFPCDELIGEENVILIPHLGASTPEAEDNCAVMAAKELKDFIENGNINNSVNFPRCSAPRTTERRITICHKNVHGMIAQFSSIMGENSINIENFVNSSKGNYAYSILDVASVNDEIIEKLKNIDGVIRIRKI